MTIEPELPCSIWHQINATYDYRRVAEWIGTTWHNNHPPFRYLRRQIILTLVRNRIIT